MDALNQLPDAGERQELRWDEVHAPTNTRGGAVSLPYGAALYRGEIGQPIEE